jgi:hypothetical protein
MICKRIIGIIAALLVGSAVATADPVGYYTVGVFSNDAGGAAQISNADSNWALIPGQSGLSTATLLVNNGANSLAFVRVNSTGVNGGSALVTPPATIILGALGPIPASVRSGGVSDFSSIDFNLDIYRTDPWLGRNGFVGEIAGKLGFGKSTFAGGSLVDTLVWTPDLNGFTIVSGGVTDLYTLGQASYSFNDASDLILTAILTQLAPEPASLLFFGTALVVLGGALRRRFS